MGKFDLLFFFLGGYHPFVCCVVAKYKVVTPLILIILRQETWDGQYDKQSHRYWASFIKQNDVCLYFHLYVYASVSLSVSVPIGVSCVFVCFSVFQSVRFLCSGGGGGWLNHYWIGFMEDKIFGSHRFGDIMGFFK